MVLLGVRHFDRATPDMDAETKAIKEMTPAQREVSFWVHQEYGRNLKADLKVCLARGARLEDLGKRYGALLGREAFVPSTIHRWCRAFGIVIRGKSC